MRSYKLRNCDTLRQIARTKYYVYDDQGEEDEDRVKTVVREIIKWNPDYLTHFQSASKSGGAAHAERRTISARDDTVKEVWNRAFNEPESNAPDLKETERCGAESNVTLTLPDIPGISAYETNQDGRRGRRWFYLTIWFIGLLIGVGFSLARQRGDANVSLLRWLEQQFLRSDVSPWQIFIDMLPWLCLWSLGVWGVWLAFRPSTSSPVRRARQRFALGWVFGLVALLPGLSLLINIVIPRAASSLTQFNDLFPLVVTWTVVIFLLYLYLSDGSIMHAEFLAAHRGIWTVLALMLLGTILSGYVGYQQVTERINGELSTLTLSRNTLLNLRTSAHALSDKVEDKIQAAQIQATPTASPQVTAQSQATPAVGAPVAPPLLDEPTWLALKQDAANAWLQAHNTQTYLSAAISHYSDGRVFPLRQPDAGGAARSQSDAQSIDVSGDYINQQIAALEQIRVIVDGVVTQTDVLSATLLPLSSLDPTETNTLLQQSRDIAAKSDVAAASMAGIGFDGLPIFTWNGMLYAALVLFPWLLLLLFLYRKRVNLASQIYNDLWRLDPSEGLLRRVLKGNTARRTQQRLERLLRKPTPPSAIARSAPAAPAPAPTRPQTESETDREQEIVDMLAKRTFGEFEYLISIVFLTALLAVGWYYVFYPQTSIGLTFLIERGAGIRQLLAFLIANLTPLTMGFTGAYFFMMEMLVRRYLSNDLYPTAFLQAALRLLVAFLLSLALTLLPTIGSDPNASLFNNSVAVPGAIALVLAFVVGIYPTSGLKLILSTVNRWLGRPFFPTTLVPEPLTKLTGVTVWVEARLFEENIESVEAMATAQIEQLIVNTHFSTGQIVDWVDQALLYLHCGHEGEWFPQLRAVGIRGASDLLDAAGLNLLAPYESLEQGCENASGANLLSNSHQRFEFCPDPQALQVLVNAITEANASGVPRPNEEDPRGVAASEMDKVRRAADSGAALAKRATELITQIDLQKLETYSYPKEIDDAIGKTKAGLKTAAGALPAVAQAASDLSASDPALPQQIAKFADEVKAAEDLADQILALDASPAPAAAGGATLSEVKLNDPASIKPHVAALCERVAAAAKLLADIERAVQRLDQAGADPAKQQALATAGAALQKAWDALGDMQQADQLAQKLDPSQAATYDARADLSNVAEQLLSALQTLDSGIAHIRDIISQRDITLTQPQNQTIMPALEGAEQALKALQQPTEETYNYARKLWPQPGQAPAQVDANRDRAALVGETFAGAHAKFQFLDTALAAVIQPPQITVDILQVICDAIWPDPNIAYILNYNKQTLADLATAQAATA